MSLSREVKIGNRTVEVPITAMDQVINFFSPKMGQDRFKIRAQMAMVGGYTAADKTRRANQAGSRRETDADTAILPDLRSLREDSQHMLRNSAIAVGAVKTNITKVVGTGLKVKSQLNREVLNLTDEQADKWQRQAEREFLLATDTREIDAERQLTFSLLQGLVLLKTLEDGDVFTNMPRFTRPGSPYKLKLQIIEAARVVNPGSTLPNSMSATTSNIVGGIEKDSNGAPVAYHVCNQHPGGIRYITGKNLTWTRLPAFGNTTGAPLVLHHYDKTRPGQTRGVPYLAPVMEVIKQLGRYTDAEVMAAVVSGMLTTFITNESGDPGQTLPVNPDTAAADPTDTGIELGYGSVVGLLPGEKIDTVNPGRPNPAFDPFVTALCRQIGVALEIPFELLVKHFTASYSAARAALLEAWAYFTRRRHWLVTSFCQPVYEAVITEAIATGRLSAPGFFSDPATRRAYLGTTWIGDAAGQIDPMKEINAAEKRMALNLTTHAEECTALPYGGIDWEAKFPQIVKEKRMMEEAGIDDAKAIPTPPPVAEIEEPAAPETPDKPEDKKDSATTDAISALTDAMAGMNRDLSALANREQPAPVINVHPAPVTVNTPDIQITQAPVNVTVEGNKPGKTRFIKDAQDRIIGAEPAED
jgi:lambda family phage portal protein